MICQKFSKKLTTSSVQKQQDTFIASFVNTVCLQGRKQVWIQLCAWTPFSQTEVAGLFMVQLSNSSRWFSVQAAVNNKHSTTAKVSDFLEETKSNKWWSGPQDCSERLSRLFTIDAVIAFQNSRQIIQSDAIHELLNLRYELSILKYGSNERRLWNEERTYTNEKIFAYNEVYYIAWKQRKFTKCMCDWIEFV